MDGWSDIEANMLYEKVKGHLQTLGATDPAVQKELDLVVDWENDYFGLKFEPFGTHNYLYGFNMKEILADTYEIVNNPKHPEYDKHKKQADDIVKEYHATGGVLPFEVGGWTAQKDVGLKMVKTQFGMMGLAILACHKGANLRYEQRVLILGAFAIEYATLLWQASVSSYVLVPAMVIGQVVVSGWKKTAWTWGVGIGVTECASYFNKNDRDERTVAGWSIITYGIFGHFFMELYKRPKLRKIMNLFKYPEFITLGIGGLGAVSAVWSLIDDPGYPNGGHKGTGHAYHHLGIAYGAWLNR